jgi:hypothetical protein
MVVVLLKNKFSFAYKIRSYNAVEKKWILIEKNYKIACIENILKFVRSHTKKVHMKTFLCGSIGLVIIFETLHLSSSNTHSHNHSTPYTHMNERDIFMCIKQHILFIRKTTKIPYVILIVSLLLENKRKKHSLADCVCESEFRIWP